MNKKLLMFGLPVLTIAIVSALLVPYISNLYEETISIRLPIEVSGTGSIEGFAEDNISITLTYENLKDNNTRGVINYYISNSEGLTCEDFNSIIVVRDGDTTPEDYIAIGRCFQDGINRIKLSSITAKSYEPSAWSVTNWETNQTHETEIILDFKNVIGEYKFESQVMYD